MTTAPTSLRPRLLLRSLERRELAFSNITPNWYAAVMGTGIVAVAAHLLPISSPVLDAVGVVFWLLAGALLVILLIASGIHLARFPRTALAHIDHPVASHFFGAPAMAFLTVGAGSLAVGRDILGAAAVPVAATLWTLGTLMGLTAAVIVPYRMFTTHAVATDAAFGGWLMPLVPPMVSAATGAALVPEVPAGQARETFVIACYAMFGLTAMCSVIVITLIWSRLAHHKLGANAMVPTLWIVLGPLGQSITASNLLGDATTAAAPAQIAHAALVFGLVWGIPVLGFTLLWTVLVMALTIRAIRHGLPFTLTWWSFTFPVGTCATGTAALAAHTGSLALGALSVLYFAGLLVGWATAAIRTAHGAVITGALLAPPA